MKRREAVFAEANVLQTHGAVRGKAGNDSSLSDTLAYKGWVFSSLHKNIVDTAESNRLQASIYARLNLHQPSVGGEEDNKCDRKDDESKSSSGVGINQSINLRIPPMVFGHDVMKIERPHGVPTVFGDDSFSLSLDAEDALTRWAAQHTSAHISSLNVIQVPYAAIWSRNSSPSAIQQQSEGVNTGVTSRPSAASVLESQRDAKDEGATGADAKATESTTIALDKRSPLWDWTFSSDYCCTLGGNRPRARQHILGMNQLYSPLDGQPSDPLVCSVKPAEMSGIEYELLRANDVPILFYDEAILYQDDLEDCGEVVFEAKLRVMPHCWFLLARMFLRVDGVLLRIRDSRFFHRFGTDDVHLEVTWKECKLALRIDRGSKDEGGEKEGGEHARGGSVVSSPNGGLFIEGSALRDINKLSQIVPVVSSANYTIAC